MTAPRVNLLPHRAAKRERQKKLFWALTGLAAVAGLFMVGAVWTVLQGYIANQEARNEFIRAENRWASAMPIATPSPCTSRAGSYFT